MNNETNIPVADHYIVRTIGAGGYWGKGRTTREAIDAAKWITPGVEVYVIRCGADASLDSIDGSLLHEGEATVLGVAKVLRNGNVGPIIPVPRKICEVAREIFKLWPNCYFGARPYLMAMMSLEKVSDVYGEEDAKGIIIYFLSNATTWRGPDARRLKAELKAIVEAK
jgi:hypothetical protein